jgi:hypothetical protein
MSRRIVRATCSSRSLDRSQHPFERRGHALPLPRKEQPLCPTLRPLDAPFGSPRRRRKDASHRLLQPTLRYAHPTTVQLPSPQLALQRPPPRSSSGGFSPECLRERGVGPPFGNPAPGGVTLDDVPPASARSITFLLTVYGEGGDGPPIFWGPLRRGVFGHVRS